jgi:hypothetical protein
MSTVFEPRHVHPLRWRQAVNAARETCARFFCEGRSPADAVRAHGLTPSSATAGWSHAVNVIAELHCAPAASFQRPASVA